MKYSSTELFLWQSIVVQNASQTSEGKSSFQDGYTLTFGCLFDYFKICFESNNAQVDSQQLSLLFSKETDETYDKRK